MNQLSSPGTHPGIRIVSKFTDKMESISARCSAYRSSGLERSLLFFIMPFLSCLFYGTLIPLAAKGSKPWDLEPKTGTEAGAPAAARVGQNKKQLLKILNL